MVFRLPLDLEYWLFTVLSNDPRVFIGFLLLAVGIFASFARLTRAVSMIIFVVGIILLSPVMGEFYLLMLVLVGLYVGTIFWKGFNN